MTKISTITEADQKDAGTAPTTGEDRCPGGPPVESEHEKMVRYVASTLVTRKGVSPQVARQLAEESVTRHEADMRDAKRRRLTSTAKARAKKKKKGPQHIYEFHGPPLQGGAPGLGKRK